MLLHLLTPGVPLCKEEISCLNASCWESNNYWFCLRKIIWCKTLTMEFSSKPSNLLINSTLIKELMSSTVRKVWNSKSCGHSSEVSNRKFGHCIHLLDFKKCSIDMPLEASSSAGFNFVPICLQCVTSVVSLMTDTLLITNVCNLLVWFAMYFSTVCLSAKKQWLI